ncbi:bifunctional UDP-N-acetylglucosamine diphosphorylase/glucosamine-1-phosphate N-acetyltransferase GlmU [Xanthobacter tagetidis]|uniref:Bifunctional protein GlmU n=1 Tax=Xanthobacter tagetidis TaxID=60216 RepID=A0A3L7AES1_9HYPH|nr:bifunctional UDP-N-acetylglucosamine diphosphorylase/glucosamine-1-phosphate N-acetyltransferase GlmU [Xanthobacter tagetidis]MBB6309837.1 bifunctional UDP-N-acetylglucosamine pyrophosphorylase/glucosamine-1-phosphate N-acetyltransferase [Xanthobacter tagetidis]RLP78290.1 bifunctional UDP-N-acetylglucosamine diphosphorylase/glucosamine-1-phosphate N-acetyltransferase GlmU [Xanthobacter tagetidis]
MGDRSLLVVVLAAGEGTRMASKTPKVLHKVAGRTMLHHVLAATAAAGATRTAVVIGPDRDDVAAEAHRVAPEAQVFVQRDRLGTAHAVLAARAALEHGADDVLVLYADTPLVRAETLARLRAPLAAGAGVAVLGFRPDDPTGYGRLVTEGDALVAIREEKDASAAERAITFCNAGLMALSGREALALLERIGNANAKGEYYLTDAVELARADGRAAVAIEAPVEEVAGVNSRVQLAEAEAILQARLRHVAMIGGATLIAPETVFFSADTTLGRDVLVEPHVVFGPGVRVGDDVVIHSFCHLEGAVLEAGVTIGPYARLRPGTRLDTGVRIGNFVETKASHIESGAKVNHLSYVGDAHVGAGANLGAGTITCNYDGFAKYRTEIGEGAFIGVNSALVAPVRIGKGAYVGTGAVITSDVPEDALAVARARQVVKDGWAKAFRARRAKPGS